MAKVLLQNPKAGLVPLEGSPVEYTERWKDNRDGTASRVKVAHLEVELIETRELRTREGTARLRTDRSVAWGDSASPSFLVEEQVKIIPVEQEIIHNGEVMWMRISEREERGQPARYQVGRIQIRPYAGGPTYFDLTNWWEERYAASHHPSWTVELVVLCQGSDEEYFVCTTWGELPTWFQDRVLEELPLCSCGRRRYDVDDEFAKCELCRAEGR